MGECPVQLEVRGHRLSIQWTVVVDSIDDGNLNVHQAQVNIDAPKIAGCRLLRGRSDEETIVRLKVTSPDDVGIVLCSGRLVKNTPGLPLNPMEQEVICNYALTPKLREEILRSTSIEVTFKNNKDVIRRAFSPLLSASVRMKRAMESATPDSPVKAKKPRQHTPLPAKEGDCAVSDLTTEVCALVPDGKPGGAKDRLQAIKDRLAAARTTCH